jgi:hypothetical protein
MKQTQFSQFDLHAFSRMCCRGLSSRMQSSATGIKSGLALEKRRLWEGTRVAARLPGLPRTFARLPSGAGRHAIIELPE